MIPPRRTGELDVVTVVLGVAALQDRASAWIESLIDDREAGQTALPHDDDFVGCLLGLAALIRAIDVPAARVATAPEDPVAARSVESLLR